VLAGIAHRARRLTAWLRKNDRERLEAAVE
jgi:hypothetical protein